MVSEICDRALTILGSEPDEAGLALLSDLCAAAYNALARQLRAGVEPTDCQENFALGAALLAVEAMRALDRGGISKFDAGTLSLDFEGSPMAGLARQLLAPWLNGGLCFRSVAP
ncbi:MAG: hypothetical protein IJ357_01785 [Oscillospiraceae bacterium]|nr:hypothetical protein [Oscillospiraceae bacterium]